MRKTIDSIKTYCSKYGNLKLWFSSPENQAKYDKLIKDYMPAHQQQLQKYFGVDFVKTNSVFYITLYKKIEHCFFKVLVHDIKGNPAYYVNSNFDIYINLMHHKKGLKDGNKLG